jgi:hypothetical protein
MRHPRELAFRLRQELTNLRLLLRQPAVHVEVAAPLPRLPDPDTVVTCLRGGSFEREILAQAESVLHHRIPLLGTVIDVGKEIDWRRDYVHGRSSPTTYFRLIPYLDFTRVGDHKVIWELNRHQHLVALAQAYRFSGRQEFLTEMLRQLESWIGGNPYLRGMNWASALEVAIRALSWIWIYHLVGSSMPPSFRERFLPGLYRHGRYLENNLSIYFSRNTHLLGEAVVLHALGALFPAFPEARRWEQTGRRIVHQEMEYQVRPDGSHFEQSTYYHIYALDMFLLHAALAGADKHFLTRLRRMAEYLDALHGPAREIPLIGDDDGGRLFHPYGVSTRFGRATLATCACLCPETAWRWQVEDLYPQAVWWLGPSVLEQKPPQRASKPGSRLFRESGTVVMADERVQAIFDAGDFGGLSGGHSHCDTLGLGEQELLVDAGTYTYVADPRRRRWFRGSAAHNTVRIDEVDQGTPASPFRWLARPQVELLDWTTTAAQDLIDAVCRYAGFVHRRRVLFDKPNWLVVLDEITGAPGERFIEQFWHVGLDVVPVSPVCFQLGARVRMVVSGGSCELETGGENGWRSLVYGQKAPAPVLRVSLRASLPCVVAAALDFSSEPLDAIVLAPQEGATMRAYRDGRTLVVWG